MSDQPSDQEISDLVEVYEDTPEDLRRGSLAETLTTAGVPPGGFDAGEALDDRELDVNPLATYLQSLFGINNPLLEVPTGGLGGTEASLGGLLSQIAELDAAALSFLQRRLFQAGFYDGAAYLNESQIRWGELDTATRDALTRAAEAAAFSRVKDFDRYLDTRAADFRRTGVNAEGENVGQILGDLSTPTATLTDPDSIQLMAEAAGQELLGRNPTEAEVAAITKALHGEQRSAARQRADLELQAQYGDIDLSATERLLSGASPNFAADYDPSRSDLGQLDTEQQSVVRTIVDVASRMGLGEEYVVAAVTAGMMESGLRNLNYGHGTSLGVFQQTQSSYGSAENRTNVEWATRAFFQELLRVPTGNSIPEWVANAQRPAGWSPDNPLGGNAARYVEFVDDAAKAYNMFATPGGHQFIDTAGYGRRPPDAADREGMGTATMRPVGRSLDEKRGGLLGPGGLLDRLKGQLGSGIADPQTSQIESPVPGETTPREEDPPGAFWIQDLLEPAMGGGMNDVFSVDPRATIEMETRRLAPVDYESKQLANRAYEFFSMLGVGGGLV